MKKEFPNIRTGVIGVGSMGQNHARVYDEISNLVAVSDLNENQGRLLSERFNVNYFSDYKSMLSEVDAVSISVPTSLHREVAENVSNAGVHLLVEKPLAGNTADAENIVSVALKNNVVLAVGHVERFNTIVEYARNKILEGEWGDIISLSASRFSNYPARIHDVGVLFDLTIHDVDVIRYLANSKIVSVSTVGGNFKNTEHEDYINLSLVFDDGKVGLCQTNWLTPMKVRELNIITTNCFVNLNYLNQEVQHLRTKYGDIQDSNLYQPSIEVIKSKTQLKSKEPLKRELIDFLESIEKKRLPLVSGQEGLEAVKIVEAGLESLLNNRVVHIK